MVVTVRYWAAIRAAAGVDADQVDAGTLANVVAHLVARHPDRRFRDVLGICSILIDGVPVGARNPDDVEVPPGATVEFLPPFAGG